MMNTLQQTLNIYIYNRIMKRIKTGGGFKCLSEGKQLPIMLHIITGGNMGDVKLR